MSAADHLMTVADLDRLDEERQARAATKYRPSYCRFCRKQFVQSFRSPHQRYCCDDHRREHFRRRKVLPLQTLIVQGWRQEAAPRQCLWCARPLPPPGKTGVLARYHKSCREMRCRAKRKEMPCELPRSVSP